MTKYIGLSVCLSVCHSVASRAFVEACTETTKYDPSTLDHDP